MPEKKKKLLLIDGNALVHRAFHALPPLTSPQGKVVNAVFGFSSLLLRIIRDLEPEYIIATFDLAGKTFRHEEYKDYKKGRVKAPQELYDQIPIVKEALAAFGIPVVEKEGYEADDVIGTLAEKASKNRDLKTIIATGDLDTLQLVRGNDTTVYTLKRGVNDTITYNEAGVMERYGLKPEQLNDFRGLRGDASDNIPGVPGIGEKTASTLIKKYKSLDGLYLAIDKNKAKDITERIKALLVENKDQAYFSKQLSTIVIDLDLDVDIEDSQWRENVKRGEIENIFKDLGFRSLIKRLDEIKIGQPSLLDLNQPIADEKSGNMAMELTDKNIPELANSAKKSGVLSLLLTEDGLNISPDGKTAYETKLDTIVGGELSRGFKELIENKNIQKIGHNIKEIVKLLNESEIDIGSNIFDTQIAAHMLGYLSRGYELEEIYRMEFGDDIPEGDNPVLHLSELQDGLDKKIEKASVKKLFTETEMPLVSILAKMETDGVMVDTKKIGELQKIAQREIAKLEKKIYKFAGEEFNINSPSQLSHILYEVLQIKGKIAKTGKGALSTAASELEKIRDQHEIIDLISQYRELQKIKTTYIDTFPALVDGESRVHTTYNQTGTATGRLSSQNPNMQNIPIRTEIGRKFRNTFVASQGTTLASLDYSQIELKVAAHLANDKKMIDTFRKGEDIHTRTAAEAFGVGTDKITKDMRRQAKVLNFGVLYGMGTGGFARAASVTREEARNFIDRYFEEFSGIANYVEETKQFARKNGYVQTLFGHRRYIPEIKASMPMLRAQAERMAVNMPIQGTQADIIKMAMVSIDKFIDDDKLGDDVKMLLQIHDELIFEIKKESVDKIVKKIKNIMESVYKLEVPITVDAKAGNSLNNMKIIE